MPSSLYTKRSASQLLAHNEKLQVDVSAGSKTLYWVPHPTLVLTPGSKYSSNNDDKMKKQLGAEAAEGQVVMKIEVYA